MRSKASVKPSAYPAIPFHGIRFIGFLSAIIVTIILIVFIYHLHADGYKLPFAFLILLITSVLSLLELILTGIVNCCCGLSTKLSIFLNVALILLWALSLGLMSYSMYGTILTSCTTEYWGNATGIKVCQAYKALFSFTVTGLASHLAAVVLDGIVRRRQTRLGKYNAMSSTAALGVGEDPSDVKLTDRQPDAVAYDSVPPPMSAAHHNGSYADTPSYGHNDPPQSYQPYQPYRDDAHGHHVRFDSHDSSVYSAPPGYGHQHTGYDPAMYR